MALTRIPRGMLDTGAVIVPTNIYTPTTTATTSTFLAGNGTWRIVDSLNTEASYTVNNLTVTNRLNAGSLTVGGIGGEGLTINSTATFNGSTIINGSLTANSTATFSEVVTTRLKTAGVLYPINTGSYGQVIANMGDYTAEWRNLGDLVFWSLSDDLRTNGFDIVSGSSSTQLTIGNGGVTGTPQGYLKFENNQINLGGSSGVDVVAVGGLNLSAGSTLGISGNTVNVTSVGNVNLSGSAVQFGNTPVFFNSNQVDFSQGIGITGGNVRFSTSTQGIQFGDGTIQRTASTSTISTTATSTRLGGVKIGSGISITADGTISAEGGGGGETVVAAGTGTAVYTSIAGTLTTYTVAVTPASEATLGAIKVGNGLIIDGGGVLSITTASYYLSPASRSEIGGVIIGSGINVTSTGSISVPVASTSTLGSIRVGANLSIDGNGILSSSASLNTGTFNLSSDARTNEFKITDGTTLNYLRLDGPGDNYDVNLVAGGSGSGVLISANTTATIIAGTVATITAGQIALSSTATTTVGSSVNTSELRVQKIYNYAGTYAPFFPAGIQLADNTVQITAYHPDGGPLPAV